MHVQSCCLLIRLRHTYPFLFENGYFFLRLSLPSTLTNPVKTVTENAPSQKRSPESRFLKTSAFLLRVDGRKRFRIRNTMMSYIIYFQHNACSIIKLWFPIVFAFSCGLATTIWICYVWLRICLKMEVKISVIKKISEYMWTGQNLLLFCRCRRWLGFLITAWPIFVHLCLFHVFLFPLCLVFSFTLEKGCF